MQAYKPELEIKKAHVERKLQTCVCGGLGMRLQMVKIDGKWWHGRCAIEKFGIDAIASKEERNADRAAWKALEDENKRLRELVLCLIENDPSASIDDAGHSVLDLWRHDARKALGMDQ